MSSANATTCSLVALVLDSTALRAAGWCEIALSALCLAAFAYTHGYRRCEPLAPLHANLKVLLYFTVIICLLNATSALAVQLAHEVACTERVHTRQRGGRLQYTRQRYFHEPFGDVCALQWTASACIAYRWPFFVVLMGYTLVHAAITVERIYATAYAHSYERANCTYSVLVIVGVLASAAFVGFWSLRNVAEDATCPYCFFPAIQSYSQARTTLTVLAALNLPIVICDIALQAKNRSQLRGVRSVDDSRRWTLQHVFPLHANVIASRVAVPLATVHIFTEAFVLVATTLIQWTTHLTPLEMIVFGEWLYCISCSYCPLAILLIYHYRRTRRPAAALATSANDATAVYFDKLRAQFDGAWNARSQPFGDAAGAAAERAA